MTTDFYPIPRMDNEKRIMRFSTSILLFLLYGTFSSLVARTSVSCISEVNITLDNSGLARIYPSMFSRSANNSSWSVEILDYDFSDKAIANCDLVGKSVMVLVTDDSGDQCMSQLNVEDKSVFSVEIKDTTLECFTPLSDLPGLITRVNDNCDRLSTLHVEYNDVLLHTYDNSRDTLRLYSRRWRFENVRGQVQEYNSSIAIRSFDATGVVEPSDTTIYCPDDPLEVDATGVPKYYNTSVFDLEETCGLLVRTSIDSGVDKFCDDRRSYLRNWYILDAYTHHLLWSGTQEITYEDTFTHRLIARDLATVDLGGCRYGVVLQLPDVNSDGCTSVPDDLLEIYVDDILHSSGDTITKGYGDTVYIRYAGIDDCWDDLTSVYDTVTYIGTDSVSIVCPAVTSPVNISIDNDLEKTVWVMALLSPDVMSCIHDGFDVVGRRLDTSSCDADTTFRKLVSFCTEDIDSTIRVEVAVMSSAGALSTNSCIVPVFIKSGFQPILECPNDTTLVLDVGNKQAIIDPLDWIVDREYFSGLESLTGSGRHLTRTGSGFQFMAGFTPLNEIDTMFGSFNDGRDIVDSDSLLLFDCGDTATYSIYLTLTDTLGQTASCEFELTVDNPTDDCLDDGRREVRVMAYDTDVMPNVKVDVRSGDLVQRLVTDEEGGVDISALIQENLDIQFSYYDDRVSGLTSHDLYLLMRYVTGVMPDMEGYHHMVADVDGSNEVDIHDVITLQRLLLGLEDNTESDEHWVFSEWNEEIRRNGEYYITSAKRGDMDGDVLVAKPRSGSTELVTYSISEASEGTYTLSIQFSDEIQGSELHLKTRGVWAVSGTEQGVAYHLDNGELHIVTGLLNSNRIELQLTSMSGSNRTPVGVSKSSSQLSTAYIDNDRKVIQLERADGKEKMYGLPEVSIHPNPSNGGSTNITINATSLKNEYEITMVDVLGHVLWEKAGNFEGRYADVTIPSSIPNGLYLIAVKMNGRTTVNKYLKN